MFSTVSVLEAKQANERETQMTNTTEIRMELEGKLAWLNDQMEYAVSTCDLQLEKETVEHLRQVELKLAANDARVQAEYEARVANAHRRD